MADPPAVKVEAEAVDSPPAVPMMDDAFDDIDDLEFYEPSEASDKMYLARVPAYLWQVMTQSASEDSEARIGTIRQFVGQDEHGAAKTKLRLLLSSERADFQGIPKEYDLDITSREVFNTFIFSEQDRPEYAAKNRARAEAIAQGIPAHLLRQNSEKKNENQGNQRGRKGWREPYRRGVQKKTKIVGRVKHELNCHPVENPESRNILELRAKQAQEPKATLKILGSANGILLAGTNEANNRFDGFVKSVNKETRKEEKAKRMENKTARMPENELLDRINHLFQRYRYWSMKALKAAVPQPETYLRATLEKVANLHKSGPFANTWSIKPELENMVTAAATEAAPDADVEGAGDGGDDDDDSDIKMEDVNVG